MKTTLNQAYEAGVVAALEKFAGKIKSNARMPPRTKANINGVVDTLKSWDSPHADDALSFVEGVTPPAAFELLHSMRRWYSGQTMACKLLDYRDDLSKVMALKPEDVVGVYRGFKVDKTNPLANASVGDRLTLDVTRNHGMSSWSTTEVPTHKFSGGGKGRVGLVIKLVDSEGIKPVLAPPEHTKEWFNEMYAKLIGTSFRPKEQEYLIAAPRVNVEIVRVKR